MIANNVLRSERIYRRGGVDPKMAIRSPARRKGEPTVSVGAGGGGGGVGKCSGGSSCGKAEFRPVKFGHYKLGRRLGKGNFAEVKLATHDIAKTKVAVKIVDKRRVDEENLRKIYREIQILKALRHPHIVKLYEIMESERMLYIVTEYAGGGEIFKLLTERGRMDELEARRLFRQIISAVAYCHATGVVHRDLKAENLLLDKDGSIKLIDFGFSNFHTPGQLLSTWCGSPPYAAPELFLGQEYDGTKADIWSLGVVLYILVCGGFPFPGTSMEKLKSAVLSGQVNIPFNVTVECTDLIRKMLVVNPQKRFSIGQVIHHRWFSVQDDYWTDEVEKLLETSCKPKQYLRPDELANRPLNNSVLLHMQQKAGWTSDKVTEAIFEKRFDAIYGTYHILCDKLRRQGGSLESSLEVAGYPVSRENTSRRGSRGSITTGLVNIELEPAPTISASDLAKLNLSSPEEDSSSESEGSGREPEDNGDFRISSKRNRLKRRMGPEYRAGGGGGRGISTEDHSALEQYLAEANRRHTLCSPTPELIGVATPPFLVPVGMPPTGFPMVPAVPFPLHQGLPHLPAVQAHLGLYTTVHPGGLLLTPPHWMQQDQNWSDWFRRASDGGFGSRGRRCVRPASNVCLKSASYAQVPPEGPLESSGGSDQSPITDEYMSVDEAGAHYLKVRGSRKRHTIHSCANPLTRQYSPFLPSSGAGGTGAPGGAASSRHFGHREPYRTSAAMRRSSDNTQLNTQNLGYLERLYKQAIGIQELQQEFQLLRATNETPVRQPNSGTSHDWISQRSSSPPSVVQPLGMIVENDSESPGLSAQLSAPPQISVTDERGAILHHSLPSLAGDEAAVATGVVAAYQMQAQQILQGRQAAGSRECPEQQTTGFDNFYYASRPAEMVVQLQEEQMEDWPPQLLQQSKNGKKSRSVLSSRAINHILTELRRVLDKMKVPYHEDANSDGSDSANSSRRVSLESDNGTKVEIGILATESAPPGPHSAHSCGNGQEEYRCKLDFKCIGGDYQNYNRLCDELISGLNL